MSGRLAPCASIASLAMLLHRSPSPPCSAQLAARRDCGSVPRRPASTEGPRHGEPRQPAADTARRAAAAAAPPPRFRGERRPVEARPATGDGERGGGAGRGFRAGGVGRTCVRRGRGGAWRACPAAPTAPPCPTPAEPEFPRPPAPADPHASAVLPRPVRRSRRRPRPPRHQQDSLPSLTLLASSGSVPGAAAASAATAVAAAVAVSFTVSSSTVSVGSLSSATAGSCSHNRRVTRRPACVQPRRRQRHLNRRSWQLRRRRRRLRRQSRRRRRRLSGAGAALCAHRCLRLGRCRHVRVRRGGCQARPVRVDIAEEGDERFGEAGGEARG